MDWHKGLLIVLTIAGGVLFVGYALGYLIITQVLKKPLRGLSIGRARVTVVRDGLGTTLPG